MKRAREERSRVVVKAPEFGSEAEEAKWWDAHQDLVADLPEPREESPAGPERSAQALAIALDRDDDEIGLGQRGACDGSRGSADDLDAGDAGLPELRGKLRGQLFGGHRDEPRPPAKGLRGGFVEVAPGGERDNRVALRELLDDGKGALADGAGGTENGEFFHRVILWRDTSDGANDFANFKEHIVRGFADQDRVACQPIQTAHM